MKASEYRSIAQGSEREQVEDLLAAHLDSLHIGYVRQAKVIPGRRFAWDFKIGDLLVEVEGAVFTGGRHVTGTGFTSGCEKQALALLAGYRTLRVTSDQVRSGQALTWIEKALELC